jgi:hypothetical protein
MGWDYSGVYKCTQVSLCGGMSVGLLFSFVILGLFYRFGFE